MNLIKKSIAVMLMLMASVPCLYAAHGDLGKQPTSWDEFVAAYSNYVSQGFWRIKGGRIAQKGKMITIDLHYLNDADKKEMYEDLNKIRLPEGSNIEYMYAHGNSEKQPTTWEEFIAAYDTVQGQYGTYEKKRINLKQGVIEINLHRLFAYQVRDLQNDLLFLHNNGNLRNENSTFNKVVFITGQSIIKKYEENKVLSGLQEVTSKVYRFYKKGFVPGNKGRVWVELSEKLDQPSMLQVKLLDPLSKVMHGKIWGTPRTLDDFIKAYNSFSSKDYPTIEQRILKGEHGITVSLRGLNFYDACGMIKDLKDLHLWDRNKLKIVIDWYGFDKKYIVLLSSTIKKYQWFDNKNIKFINRPMMQPVLSSPKLCGNFSPVPLKPKAKTAPSSPGVFGNFSDFTSSLISSPALNSETNEEKAKAESVPSYPQLFSLLAYKYLEQESEELSDSSDSSDSISSFIDFPILNSESNEEKPKAKSSSMQPKSNTKCVRFNIQPLNPINSKAKTAPSSPEVFSNFGSSKSSLISSLMLSSETNEKNLTELSSPQPFSNFDFNDTTDQKFTLSIPNTTTNIASGPKSNVDKRPSAQSAPSSPGLFDNFDFTKIKKQKSTSPLPKPPILSLGNSAEKPKPNTAIKRRDTSSKFSAQMNRKNQPV